MKVRIGFVSNSSSASFIIHKERLLDRQIKMIKSAPSYVKSLGMDSPKEAFWGWSIGEDHQAIWGTTCMDNFGMAEFFTKMGLRWDVIGWWDSNNNREKVWREKQRKGEYPIDKRTSKTVR